jgi:hypothetical protein
VRTSIALSVKGFGATDSAASSAWPIAKRAGCVDICSDLSMHVDVIVLGDNNQTMENGPCQKAHSCYVACVSPCMAVPPSALNAISLVSTVSAFGGLGTPAELPCRDLRGGHACLCFTADACI